MSFRSNMLPFSLVNRARLLGKRLKVSIARPRNHISGNVNLYVAGLPLMYDESHLHHLFSPYGTIVEARALRGAHL